MKGRRLCVGLALLAAAAALLALPGAGIAAGTTTIYDSTPSPLPGNIGSYGAEAYSYSEFGDEIQFAGTQRALASAVVDMSSWGCTSGHWYDDTCTTTPGSTFSVDITLTLYNVGGGDTLGSQIAQRTQTFTIPYRPSDDDVNCPPTDGTGRWFDASTNTCFHGLAVPITFDLTGITVPNSVIYTLSYNTTTAGPSPIGPSTCSASAGGCGYDSLNVGWVDDAPSVGTDADPATFWVNDSAGRPGDCISTQNVLSKELNTCSQFGGLVPGTPAVQFNAAQPGTGLTTAMQAMNGDFKVPQGSTLLAGFDFTMPGKHPAATVGFTGTTVTFPATCASGTPGSATIVVHIADQSYADPANSNAWFPSGDQNAASTYQGSATVPSFCDPGALVRLQKGGTFSTFVTSTDTTDKVNVRWHYKDGTGGAWSGTYGVIPS